MPPAPSHSDGDESDASAAVLAAGGAGGREYTGVGGAAVVVGAVVVVGAAVVVGASVVVGAAVVVGGGRRGHGGRLHHRRQQVGHAGEGRRDAGRVVGRGDPAQGQEAGEVGLRCREADGLDVLTLDGRDGLVQRGGAAIVLAVRQDHEHPALGRRRELLAGGDHGVVQRGVAVGDDPVDLLASAAPGRSSAVTTP